MKKRPLAAIGRTCPHCSKTVDQVCYGWHTTQCPAGSDKPAITPALIEISDDSQLQDAHLPVTPSGDVPSHSVYYMPRPSSTPSMRGEGEDQEDARLLPLRSSNPSMREEGEDQEDAKLLSIENRRPQPLDPINQEIQQLRKEYQALLDKVKHLEHTVEDLQTQLTWFKADSGERDVLCSCEKLAERGLCSKSTQTCTEFGMVKFDSNRMSGIVSQACEDGPKQEVQPPNVDTCLNAEEPMNVVPSGNQACGEDGGPAIGIAKQGLCPIVSVSDDERQSENCHFCSNKGKGLACGGDVIPEHDITSARCSLEEENVNCRVVVVAPSLDVSADGTCDEVNEECQSTPITRWRHKVAVSSSDDSRKVSWKPFTARRNRLVVATSSESSHGMGKKDAGQDYQPTSQRVRKNQRMVMSSSGDSASVLRKADNEEEASGGCAKKRPQSRRVVLPVSDDSADAAENDQCEHRNTQLLKDRIGSLGANGITSRDNQRNKRLRTASFGNQKKDLEAPVVAGMSPTTSGDRAAGSSTGSHMSSRRTSSLDHGKRKETLRTRRRLFEECKKLFAVDNDDTDWVDSESQSSLDGFIAESESIEDLGNSDEYASTSSSFFSEDNWELEFRHIERMVKIMKYSWVDEVEMLMALGRDTKLCLRAICALNRRQTADEQMDKAAKYVNKRGFDKLHSARGTRIAEFLTDGDPSGPVKKSIEELKVFDASAVRLCRRLAFKHSKQLFDMYSKEEDPHFPSS